MNNKNFNDNLSKTSKNYNTDDYDSNSNSSQPGTKMGEYFKRSSRYRSRRGNHSSKFNNRQNQHQTFTGNKSDIQSTSKVGYTTVKTLYKNSATQRGYQTPVTPEDKNSYNGFFYPVMLDTNNRILTGNLAGSDNLTSNDFTILATSSNATKLTDLVDAMVMFKTINYNYLPLTEDARNIAMLNEYIHCIVSAIATQKATLNYELPGYKLYHEAIRAPRTTAFEGNDLGFAMQLIQYQSVLQSLNLAIQAYIMCLRMEEHILNMEADRSSPILAELFSQLKKKPYCAAVNALSIPITNGYFDTAWATQMNNILLLPSRKANSMEHPLLQIITNYQIPHTKVYNTRGDTTPLFDSETTLRVSIKPVQVGQSWVQPYRYLVNLETMRPYNVDNNGNTVSFDSPQNVDKKEFLTFSEIIRDFCFMHSPYFILKWARRKYHNKSNSNIDTPNKFTNLGRDFLTMLTNQIIGPYFSNTAYLKTLLKAVSTSQTLYWIPNIAILADNSNNYQTLEITHNLLIDGIFQSTFTGGAYLSFNVNTQRYNVYSPYFKTKGLPLYDTKSGGSIITYGDKINNHFDSTSPEAQGTFGLFPTLYDPPKTIEELTTNQHFRSFMLSRNSTEFEVKVQVLDTQAINDDPVLARLNLVNRTDMQIKIPTVEVADSQTSSRSHIIKTLEDVFGYGQIFYSTDGIAIVCSSDLILFYGIELASVAEDTKLYVNNYNPYKLATPDPSLKLGLSNFAR